MCMLGSQVLESRLVYQQLFSVYLCLRGILLVYGVGSLPMVPSGFHSGLWTSIAGRPKHRDLFGSVLGTYSFYLSVLSKPGCSHPSSPTRNMELVLHHLSGHYKGRVIGGTSYCRMYAKSNAVRYARYRTIRFPFP